MPKTNATSYLVLGGFIVLVIAMIALAFQLGARRPEAPRAPVPTNPESTGTTPVTLYAYDPRLDMDPQGNVLCSAQGLVPITRAIPDTEAPLREALTQLFASGLTEDESARGLMSEFPLQGVSIEDVVLRDGVATITVRDREHKTSGGSCRVSVMRAQIEATAKEFSNVKEVRFLPDEAFQP